MTRHFLRYSAGAPLVLGRLYLLAEPTVQLYNIYRTTLPADKGIINEHQRIHSNNQRIHNDDDQQLNTQ